MIYFRTYSNNYNFRIRLIKFSVTLLLILIFTIIDFDIQNKKDELKRKFDTLLPFQQKIINNYLSDISQKYIYEKKQELYKLISLLSLSNFSKISNDTLKSELKIELLKALQKAKSKKKKSQIKFVFIEKSYRFGNSLVLLNNLLYYSEILNITNIYLNSEKKWPITENITSNKINISLTLKKNVNLKDKSICIFDKKFIYYQRIFKPEIRIDLLKFEIKKNLPKIVVNPKDLFIHIRGGDIFKYKSNKGMNYAQPPLCFYQSIIDYFTFRNIFIISQDKKNPIINLLIKMFKQIIIAKNSINIDISLLLNAYNIVGSISSFFTTLIIINDNLKILWEYDLYRLPEKYFHLHRDTYNYKINYSIYKMSPSKKYRYLMFPWINSRQQRDLMINEKCNKFKYIRPKTYF